jgi:hypothetical protein
MAYNLQAIIGKRSILERHASDFGKVRVASLRQGFGLIPVVHDLWEQVRGVEPVEPRLRAFVLREEELPTPFINWMERMSLDGAVAYVEKRSQP